MVSKYKVHKFNVSDIIFYVLIVLLIFLTLNIISLKSDEGYNIIRFRTYTVVSGSMEPAIHPGDLIVIIKSNNFKEDDIITFKNSNQVITHRIEEVIDDGFITKGDNNNFIDSDIVREIDIIGKVILTIPKFGIVTYFLSERWVISAELILLGFIIILNNRGKQ